MKKVITVIGAAGTGAGLMYLFDPDRGRRRRAMLRNKAEHARRITVDAAGKTQRDVRNHLRGLVSEFGSLFQTDEVMDEVLVERVRAKMGRVVSHPHAVDVTVRDGEVILRGAILADEVHPLLNAIIEIDGIKNVSNWLQVHASADVPVLQGGRQRPGKRFGPFKTNWSPTTRLIATLAGGVIAIYGAKRRGLVGSGLALAGTTLAARALTNFEVQKRGGKVREQSTEQTAQPPLSESPSEVAAAHVA